MIETSCIEDHLLGKLSGQEDTLFQARLLLDEHLADHTHWQKETYKLVRTYGRMQLKQEILDIHKKLFEQPEHSDFRQKVQALFRKR